MRGRRTRLWFWTGPRVRQEGKLGLGLDGPPGRTGKKVSFFSFFLFFICLFVFQNLFQIEFLNQIK
jgi:hypothetical protein